MGHDHARRARAGECIHLTFAEAPFGAQLGAFGLHGLNLRLQRADPELGDPVVDLHQHLAGFDLHTLAHGKIGDPTVGAARYRHNVGRDARIVFIDMGQPQMQLAAAIDERDTEQVSQMFVERGYTMTVAEDEADVVLINTCSVTATPT